MIQATVSASPDSGKLVKSDGNKGGISGGYWFEFGVYRGVSLNMTGIANRYLDLSLDIHGFDTFTGLPDEWVGHMGKGAFNLSGILPPVEPSAHLHKGLIEETFPAFLTSYSCKDKKVVGVNIDCDLFGCTKLALSSLEPCLHSGSMLHFHELVHIMDDKNPMEEMKALYEWLQSMEKKHESVSLEMLPVTNTAFEAVAFILR
eukprot:scaffold225_cov194-Ochromonas_danica.AAC.6